MILYRTFGTQAGARAPALAAVLLMAGLVACSGPQEEPAPTPTPAPEPTTTPAPGSDRDAHGCIPSAGYAWCERSGQCERPWELAAQAGLDNTAEAFDEYCAATETEAPAQDG